ncbi:sigma factor G inhibitor Gin [Alkaliphilus oremlandii]|uniref:sigma factor G inhibitor Gin n=1 Tax=Alkaliphilus oremlandii TaxID=461876 RepID=UPI0005A035E9
MEEGLSCCFCNKIDDEGIILLNQYICRSCELEITHAGSNELRYEIIKKNLKSIWKGALFPSH